MKEEKVKNLCEFKSMGGHNIKVERISEKYVCVKTFNGKHMESSVMFEMSEFKNYLSELIQNLKEY